MRWSRLKKLLEDILDPDLDLKIHCSAYRGEDGPAIGRYWIILNGQIIFDEPKQISRQLAQGLENTTATQITGLLRTYLDTPKEDLLSNEFPGDLYGLIDILRAADRRIGKRRVLELMQRGSSAAVCAVIQVRFPGIL